MDLQSSCSLALVNGVAVPKIIYLLVNHWDSLYLTFNALVLASIAIKGMLYTCFIKGSNVKCAL